MISCRWPINSMCSSRGLFVGCKLPVGRRGRSVTRSISAGLLAGARGGRAECGKYSCGDHCGFYRLGIGRSFNRFLLQEAVEETGIELRGAKIRVAQDAPEE